MQNCEAWFAAVGDIAEMSATQATNAQLKRVENPTTVKEITRAISLRITVYGMLTEISLGFFRMMLHR